MKPPNEMVQDIIHHLGFQLAKSWKAFLVAKLVHEQRNTGRINCSHYFFSSVEESCLETAILILAKISISHIDSISIPYLLDYSEQNPTAYLNVGSDEIRSLVSMHRKEIEKLSSILGNIKEQRDRTIAHLDKKHIKKPSSVYAFPPLNLADVENLYVVLLNIVNDYSKYLVPSSEIRLDSIKPGVIDDVEYLTSLIEKDNDRE